MPGFTVKSSFHLRNKENSKCSICAPCKCSPNCHGRAGHKPRNFQNLKCKLAANALDISVTLFYTIDLENSTFILTMRGAEAILFLTKTKSNTTGKQTATSYTFIVLSASLTREKSRPPIPILKFTDLASAAA